ncbi:hypothetical protein KJ765_00230 [Candidatus Micrarchaeota archaeon]|nr:hypothetical protein [Candidatus Micrarchaeota archaeon]
MDQITGFDSKEYHAGRIGHFFAPIGIGVSVSNYETFKTEYSRLWRDILDDRGLEYRRKVYSARDLLVLFPQEKYSLEEDFLEGIRRNIIHTTFYFTQLPNSKRVYSRGWLKNQPASEFMQRGLNQYPYWCAWKHHQSESSPSHSPIAFLDEFAGEETTAWNTLCHSSPRIFYRGDNSNPLISTADVLLDFLDGKLRLRRLTDNTIEAELSSAGLHGNSEYIGVPDLRYITPISRRIIDKAPFRARPTYFLLFEERPSLINRKEWEQSRLYSRMMDFAIKEAFENNGCVKFYDWINDFKFLNNSDVFIWSGEKGRQVVKGIAEPNGAKDIYFSNQEGI